MLVLTALLMVPITFAEENNDQKTDEELSPKQHRTQQQSVSPEEIVPDEPGDHPLQPDWARRISIGGDVRLRYQSDTFPEGNADFADPTDLSRTLNTSNDRHRYRYRARLDVNADIIDDRSKKAGRAKIGMRLSTGSENNPISTNETMGDFNNKDKLLFDRAFLQYAYKPGKEVWGGKLPEIKLTGGRFANPFESTNLIWDGDLNFEGFALNFTTDTLTRTTWSMFMSAGYFPLQEVELVQEDKFFWGGQLGFEFRPSSSFTFQIAGAFYDFQNITGKLNEPDRPDDASDYTAPLFQTKGNALFIIDSSVALEDQKTGLAAEYQLANASAKMTLKFFAPIEIVIDADYVINLALDVDEVVKLTEADKKNYGDEGYQFGFLIGYPKIANSGQWHASVFYRYLETDAVLDAFTDSDFRGGGTNAKGWGAGFGVGLYKNVWLSAKWMSADEITGPQFAQDTLQVDINGRF
jgi:hypothetical protein